MKRLLMLGLSILSINNIAYADGAANIHMRITGAASDNTYFLCLPNVGCLSILAGDRGKIYPVYHTIEMNDIFVTDVDHNFRLSSEGLPSSCHVTVQQNQTVTISGRIESLPNGTTYLAGLNCRLS